MGGRITIDSATLMNKGLEVIEAHHLFGVGFDRIDEVIHPQSVLHSAVELVDGSLKAHLGHPDMRIPIQYALTFPHRAANPAQPFTLVGLRLDFEAPDRDLFPALDLAYAAGRRGGTAPAVLNAADEVAVEEFLAGRLPFPAITAVVEETLAAVPATAATDLEEVRRADTQARQVARRVARDFR
jgi:1-deoxy-D-xylulose-5-phosphate reductoisomerase